MYDSIFALCTAVTTGPISASASMPFFTFSDCTRGINASTSLSATLPTATATEIAMQRSPADPYAAPISASTACSRFASGITTRWFFAPPSACTRNGYAPLRFAPSVWMYSAIGVEPTNDTAFTSGCCNSASTATLSPCTTLKTPSGRPARLNRSAIISDGDGSRSDGFRIKVLPVAIAIGAIHIGTMNGKLNGVMPAVTPKG